MRLILQESKTEEALIKGCQKGNSRDQQALFEKHSAKMMGVCYRYVKDSDEAEDVMISAFAKVFEKLDSFRFEGSFEGWLRRIMVNESLMYLRRNKSMYVEVEIEKADREPDFSQLSDQLEADDLMAMIQELPVGYRTVFNLYAIEGFSHQEIAEMMEISEGTSKSQLSRARALLQKQLLEQEKKMNDKTGSHEH
ncbi:MAG: RNA polymerase sigma factor [Imperialibacter sp.]|uniref:RNA polymerase sigma factor n=1 Tax=Imperialibacter sp. TaxID=2038411 RepID=UPI0032EECF95